MYHLIDIDYEFEDFNNILNNILISDVGLYHIFSKLAEICIIYKDKVKDDKAKEQLLDKAVGFLRKANKAFDDMGRKTFDEFEKINLENVYKFVITHLILSQKKAKII